MELVPDQHLAQGEQLLACPAQSPSALAPTLTNVSGCHHLRALADLSLSYVTKIDRFSLNQVDVWHKVSRVQHIQFGCLCPSGHIG